jgi:serine/threonine protein kinase
MSGLILGRYEIISEIGRGNMGIVYLAKDTRLQRTIALKEMVFKDAAGGREWQELIERFHREAVAACRSPHPNILTVYDVAEEEGRYFITMEYLEGWTLDHYLKSGSAFDLSQSINIIVHVAQALQAAHQAGVVHRDIKPANIMILKDGGIKVMDFGIAHVVDSGTLTVAGTIIGSPGYMSPEQVTGQVPDGRSDIFSLGVIFYQLITGEKPFQGESLSSIVYQIVQTEPVAAGRLNPGMPEYISSVIRKCMAKNPAERYQNAAGLIADLLAARAPSQPPQSPMRNKLRTKTVALLALVVLLLVMLIGAGIYMAGGESGESFPGGMASGGGSGEKPSEKGTEKDDQGGQSDILLDSWKKVHRINRDYSTAISAAQASPSVGMGGILISKADEARLTLKSIHSDLESGNGLGESAALRGELKAAVWQNIILYRDILTCLSNPEGDPSGVRKLKIESGILCRTYRNIAEKLPSSEKLSFDPSALENIRCSIDKVANRQSTYMARVSYVSRMRSILRRYEASRGVLQTFCNCVRSGRIGSIGFRASLENAHKVRLSLYIEARGIVPWQGFEQTHDALVTILEKAQRATRLAMEFVDSQAAERWKWEEFQRISREISMTLPSVKRAYR